MNPTPATTDIRRALTIREFASLADYDACVALQDETWGHGFSERVPGAILRVAQKIGGVSAGAFDATGRMLGFVFGMTGVRHGALVHWSDMLAVRPEARGTRTRRDASRLSASSSVRAARRSHACSGPPIRSSRATRTSTSIDLGARPVEYVENMYGDNTGSVLHGAMPTDRFVYHWDLDATSASRAHAIAAARECDASIPSAIAVAR